MRHVKQINDNSFVNLRVVSVKLLNSATYSISPSNLMISKIIFSTSMFYEAYKRQKNRRKNASFASIDLEEDSINNDYEFSRNKNNDYLTDICNLDFNLNEITFLPKIIMVSTRRGKPFLNQKPIEMSPIPTISRRRFIDLTPKVTNVPSAKEVTWVASKHTRLQPTHTIYKPMKTSVRSKCWWKNLNFVSIINLDYPSGDAGQLFCDLANQESESRSELHLICFEDINDARGLINILTERYMQEIQRITPVMLKPLEAEAIAKNVGLDLFVLRKKELELGDDWTLDDFNFFVSRINEIRKWSETINRSNIY